MYVGPSKEVAHGTIFVLKNVASPLFWMATRRLCFSNWEVTIWTLIWLLSQLLNMLCVASDLVSNGVRLVILGEVLFRRKAHIPIQIYNAKVGDYNNCLRTQLIDPTYPRHSSQRFANANIWQWDHLQMRRSVLPLLKDDSIHLKDHPGNSRLYWSVWLAFKQAIQYLD